MISMDEPYLEPAMLCSQGAPTGARKSAHTLSDMSTYVSSRCRHTYTMCRSRTGDQVRRFQRVSFEVSFPYARPCGMLMANMMSAEKRLCQVLRVPFFRVGGRHKAADVVRRASIRRVGPCEMVWIDGGGRTVAGRPLLLVCRHFPAASARGTGLAAHTGRTLGGRLHACMHAFRVPSRLD